MKTIKDVLEALSNCKYYGTCDKCPYSGEELPTCVFEMKSDAIHAINRLLAENQSLHEVLDMYGGEEGVTAVYEERDCLADENRALRTELKVNLGNEYWMNICKMNAHQEAKGLKKYGETLEENTTLTTVQRIEHLQEELIDGLKYCEHLKATCNDGITANDYQRACLRTAPGDKSEWLENAIYGIIGEAGEIVDLVKKHKWQGHTLNAEDVALELGDLLWYGSLLASAINYDLGTVMQMNEKKLEQRYPEGFSKDRSVNRDKD